MCHSLHPTALTQAHDCAPLQSPQTSAAEHLEMAVAKSPRGANRRACRGCANAGARDTGTTVPANSCTLLPHADIQTYLNGPSAAPPILATTDTNAVSRHHKGASMMSVIEPALTPWPSMWTKTKGQAGPLSDPSMTLRTTYTLLLDCPRNLPMALPEDHLHNRARPVASLNVTVETDS